MTDNRENQTQEIIIPNEIIQSKIYLIREQKVMLDSDLAEIYNVETRVLKQSVRRNISRFPEDFMFELNKNEYDILRSQSVILKRGQHTKYLPFAFTEQGIAMLSSVLNSQRAIMVNIQIIRAFVKLREMLSHNINLRLEVEQIKKKLDNQDKNIELVFTYLDELMEKQENPKPRNRIGFKKED